MQDDQLPDCLNQLFSCRLIYFFYMNSNYSFIKAVADPQSLLEEKEALEEKLALCEYEFRLAKEDIVQLKTELQKKSQTFPRQTSGTSLKLFCTFAASSDCDFVALARSF